MLSINRGDFYDAPTVVTQGPEGRRVETLPMLGRAHEHRAQVFVLATVGKSQLAERGLAEIFQHRFELGLDFARSPRLAESAAPWPVASAELSVLWYTAGQGEEDFAVHHFQRFVDEPGRPLDLRWAAEHDVDEVAFRAKWRVDGDIIDTNAGLVSHQIA